MMNIKKTIAALTEGAGVSGAEEAVIKAEELLREYADDVHRDTLGNVIGTLGKGEKHILLDAHLDRIGLVVTAVDQSGFLRVDRCGGADPRVLCAAEVVIWGKKPIYGVVTSTPPHLAKEADKGKAPKFDEIFIDTGMKYEELKEIVAPGDRITINYPVMDLAGNRIAGSALDDRAGVAAILRTLEIIKEQELGVKLTIMFSAQEEVGGNGSITGAFEAFPDEAIVVDVTFAEAPGIDKAKCGKLGEGVAIGIAPILDKGLTDRLVAISQENSIKHTLEVSSRSTGTNADDIGITRTGIRTAVLSIPLRSMHTQAEIIDTDDVEATAQLMAKYILGEGGRKDV